jgi:exopolyphosphatase/guanosine-5'-triphosphate,3'-diphosphate pyrophosphatase
MFADVPQPKVSESRSRPVAVCDMGSFSALFLIVRHAHGHWRTLLEERRTIDVLRDRGRGGRLSSPAINRMLAVAGEFSRRAEAADCGRAAVVCTAALRETPNRASIIARLRRAAGCQVVVLSARKEALYSFSGARIGLRTDATQGLMIDVGGGSTEVVSPRNSSLSITSIPWGAARATAAWRDGCPRLRRQRAAFFAERAHAVAAELPAARGPVTGTVVGVGGTVVTLAAIRAGLEEFDPQRLHGRTLSRHWLNEMAGRLSMMTQSRIGALIPFDPSRARVLTAGTFLWGGVLDRYGASRVVISVRGLRWGVAARLAAGLSI